MTNRHQPGLRLMAVLSLLALVWAPALPAARADDGPPPALDSAPVDPAESAPAVPADGVATNRPTGCVYFETGPGNYVQQHLPDLGTITSTVPVNIPSGTYLWDLKLTTTISHSYSGDLDIHLISPAGTDVAVSHRNGGATDNVFWGTVWEDQAPLVNYPYVPITDDPLASGYQTHLNPQEPFGVLRGQNPNGLWTLVIHDQRALDEGHLYNWKLDVIALAHAPDYSNHYVASQGPVAISDGGSANLNFNVPYYHDPITAITVTTNITHNNPGDLDVFLISPTGITITLSSGNGLTNTNALAGVAFDDAAGLTNLPGPITLHTFAPNVPAGRVAPEEALSEMLGRATGGFWQVKVIDRVTNSQSGTLARASLGFFTGGCNPNLGASMYSGPAFPRLGQSANITLTSFNSSITATNLSLDANLAAALRFQSVSGAWTCSAPPPPNTPGAHLHCTRPGQDQNSNITEVMTVTAPALLAPAPVTLTLTIPNDTYLANNTRVYSLPVFAHSANLQPLDFDLPNSNGAILNGGQFALNGWGKLRVTVDNFSDSQLTGFGLLPDGTGQHWTTITPQTLNGVQMARRIWAPANQNWVRYVDTFTNTSGQGHSLKVVWGGSLGSYTSTGMAASSTSDLALTHDDVWAVTKFGPPASTSDTPPVGFVLRSASDTSYSGPTIFNDPSIDSVWPPSGEPDLGHHFVLFLASGQTRRLAYFVTRGLAEGKPGPQDCNYYGGCVTPALGAQVSAVTAAVSALAANPPLCDLTPAEQGSLANWPGLVCSNLFLPVGFR